MERLVTIFGLMSFGIGITLHFVREFADQRRHGFLHNDLNLILPSNINQRQWKIIIQMEDLENILPTFSLKETVILKDSAKRNYTICCSTCFRYNNKVSYCLSQCGHVYCCTCVTHVLNQSLPRQCPNCPRKDEIADTKVRQNQNEITIQIEDLENNTRKHLSTIDCSICLGADKIPHLLIPCGHGFCEPCAENIVNETQPRNCPLCRMNITGKLRPFLI